MNQINIHLYSTFPLVNVEIEYCYRLKGTIYYAGLAYKFRYPNVIHGVVRFKKNILYCEITLQKADIRTTRHGKIGNITPCLDKLNSFVALNTIRYY